MKKTPEEIAENFTQKQRYLVDQACEHLGPRTIGRHVLAILGRGETLDVDALRRSLQEAAAGGTSASERDLARWAAEEIDALIASPRD